MCVFQSVNEREPNNATRNVTQRTTLPMSVSPGTRPTEQASIAHTVNGQPQTARRVPFRNVRQVLSMHAKTNGRRTFMIHYNAADEREELSYAEFNARAHQTANMLFDDLGVHRGDRVAVVAHNDSVTAMIYVGCWIIGAAVVPIAPQLDAASISHILNDSGASVCLTHKDYIQRLAPLVVEIAHVKGIVTVGGEALPDYPHFNELVRNLPTTFLGDGAPVKSDDDALREPNDETAVLDDVALVSYTADADGALRGAILTQYNLLVSADAVARAQAITGGQRLLGALPLHTLSSLVFTLLVPMMTAASVVLSREFSVGNFWRRAIVERVHILQVQPEMLHALLAHGREQEATGNGLFGDNVNRRGLTHFRHFLCVNTTSGQLLTPDLARDFVDLFGFPVLNSYGTDAVTAFCCLLPIDLTWVEYQAWLHGDADSSVGVPHSDNEVTVLDADGGELGPGKRGEISVRGHNVMQGYQGQAEAETFAAGWLRTGDEGYYMEDERDRRFFFVTGRA